MTVTARAGLPTGPWSGRAALVFEHSVWFEDGSPSLLGLAAWHPSPRGMAVRGSWSVRVGSRLESDGSEWFLEGTGRLEGVGSAPEQLVTLSEGEGGAAPAEWRARWTEWLRPYLTETPWLAGLLGGPGDRWQDWIGYGPGSTPAGDDYLAGWAAARMTRGLFGDRERRRLKTSLDRTSRLSRHYLWNLAEGRVDALLAGFLEQRPFPEDALSLRLAQRGGTSGRATLTGMIAGLSGD